MSATGNWTSRRSQYARHASRRIGKIVVLTGACWIFGIFATYVVAPANTGYDYIGAYASFQAGSALGNVIALLSWTVVTAVITSVAVRIVSQGGASVPWMLIAAGVTAVTALYPSICMSAAVGHVVPIETLPDYNDGGALLFAGIGTISLISGGSALLIKRVNRIVKDSRGQRV